MTASIPKPKDLEKVLAPGAIRAGGILSLAGSQARVLCSHVLITSHTEDQREDLPPSLGDESLEGGSVVHIQLISLSELRLED